MVHRFSTQRPRTSAFAASAAAFSSATMLARAFAGLCVIAFCAVGIPTSIAAQQSNDATLFRIFLINGTSLVSYGEYARVFDEIVFSMPVGESTPRRLHVITLPVSSVDWNRTESYAASARYQRYAATRGEADFAALSAEVAAMLNEAAAATEPERAKEIANEARRLLLAWPANHFGYRQNDIADIIALIDEAMSGRGTPLTDDDGTVQLSLVSLAPPITIEPVLGNLSSREQVARLVTIAGLTSRSADRIRLLRAALEVLEEPSSTIDRDDARSARRSIESQLRDEVAIDERYDDLAKRLTTSARRAASNARVANVERAIKSLDGEDAKLGARRPEMISALRAELQAQLEAARELRLRRDQWQVRQQVYRAYVESISVQVLQLVKAKPSLDDIRRLAGPPVERLMSLRSTLGSGADRLDRVAVPEQLRTAHDLLLNAWRMAESAVDTRRTAVVSGSMESAQQASTAAAGALLLFDKAQAELRSALEPPRLR